MNKFRGDIYKVIIQPITPIHIGSGNEILPYEYVIRDNYFYKINMIEIYDKFDKESKKQFENLISKGLIEVRNWIKQNYNESWGYTYKISVTSEFEKIYNKKIGGVSNKNEENELAINEFIKSFDRFYIPGSAVKGAIRSAYVMSKGNFNYNLEKTKDKVPRIKISFPNNKKESDTYESNTLRYRNAKQDPFKAVKITDLVSNDLDMKVGEVRMYTYKKRENDFVKAMPVYEEMIKGSMENSDKNNIFEGKLQTFFGFYEKNALELKIVVKDIIKALNEKAKKMIENELKFYKKAHFKDTLDVYQEIEKISNSLSENEAIIRLGKGCGFESNTFYYKNNGRNVEIASKQLSENIYPMGWAIISFLKEGENYSVKSSELKFNNKIVEPKKESSIKSEDISNTKKNLLK